jgi:hypothetical protein
MTTEWCDRNWHDGTCCPGSIRQWHLDHDLLPPTSYDDVVDAAAGIPDPFEPHGLDTTAAGWSWAEAHGRGDHSACNRNCEHTL